MGSGNKGSSAQLVNYLDKENKELEKNANRAPSRNKEIEIRSRQQYFFGHESDAVSQMKVKEDIDKNIAKLGKKDAKYFAPTISFSKDELKHISTIATGGRSVKNTTQMNNSEFGRYNDLLRGYSRVVMDNYAKNFNREEKGLKSGKDLVYYAKIEHDRAFKGNDKEVRFGNAKSGDKKPGLQSHVHVIVSRKDQTQRLKLSPVANEKSTTRTIGNNKYHVGFDRKQWIAQNENSFDKMFKYQRKEVEKFAIQNSLKNGSREEKIEAQLKISQEKEAALELNQQHQKSRDIEL
ncbi:DUF5712 family protein [Zobellia laminariae]|uniref:DUF5712 family protein n=1 Tax=Zobellia laminariae TaxID=248906 RepID=UPI003EF3EB7A